MKKKWRSLLHYSNAFVVLVYSVIVIIIEKGFSWGIVALILLGIIELFLGMIRSKEYSSNEECRITIAKISWFGEAFAYVVLLVFFLNYMHIVLTINSRDVLFDSRTDQSVCILVLGAQLKENEMTPYMKDRLDIVVDSKSKLDFSNDIIIVSGGYGRYGNAKLTESQVMYDYLIAAGIPYGMICQENKARSTYENILYTKKQWSNHKLLVVSSDFHLPRIKKILDTMGCANYELVGAKTALITKPYFMLDESLALFALSLDIT